MFFLGVSLFASLFLARSLSLALALSLSLSLWLPAICIRTAGVPASGRDRAERAPRQDRSLYASLVILRR